MQCEQCGTRLGDCAQSCSQCVRALISKPIPGQKSSQVLRANVAIQSRPASNDGHNTSRLPSNISEWINQTSLQKFPRLLLLVITFGGVVTIAVILLVLQTHAAGPVTATMNAQQGRPPLVATSDPIIQPVGRRAIIVNIHGDLPVLGTAQPYIYENYLSLAGDLRNPNPRARAMHFITEGIVAGTLVQIPLGTSIHVLDNTTVRVFDPNKTPNNSTVIDHFPITQVGIQNGYVTVRLWVSTDSVRGE